MSNPRKEKFLEDVKNNSPEMNHEMLLKLSEENLDLPEILNYDIENLNKMVNALIMLMKASAGLTVNYHMPNIDPMEKMMLSMQMGLGLSLDFPDNSFFESMVKNATIEMISSMSLIFKENNIPLEIPANFVSNAILFGIKHLKELERNTEHKEKLLNLMYNGDESATHIDLQKNPKGWIENIEKLLKTQESDVISSINELTMFSAEMRAEAIDIHKQTRKNSEKLTPIMNNKPPMLFGLFNNCTYNNKDEPAPKDNHPKAVKDNCRCALM